MDTSRPTNTKHPRVLLSLSSSQRKPWHPFGSIATSLGTGPTLVHGINRLKMKFEGIARLTFMTSRRKENDHIHIQIHRSLSLPLSYSTINLSHTHVRKNQRQPTHDPHCPCPHQISYSCLHASNYIRSQHEVLPRI